MKNIDLNTLSKEELIKFCKEQLDNFKKTDLKDKSLSDEEKINLFN